ncbi:MAG: hypothetical protein WD178_05135 [Actinomycetota bacterium]
MIAQPQAPFLAEGVGLLGEFKGAGTVCPGYLLRRPDGAFLMVSALLYGLAEELDGRRCYNELAEQLNYRFARNLKCEDIGLLLGKLEPLGVIAGTVPAAKPVRPLLGVSACVTLVAPGLVLAAARVLQPLFHRAVVVPVLPAAIVLQLALIGSQLPLAPAEVLREPAVILAVLAITLLGGLFHELGHASAAVYGGTRPGPIGVGMHLFWPAFYTDTTESYQSDRWCRVRTDLGGVYFNLLLSVALGLAFAVTGDPIWFWAMLAQDLTIVQQFLPFLRLDGYYLACDLAGVPDLFSEMAPALRGRRRPPPHHSGLALRRGVRAFVLAWSIATAAFLGWFGVKLTLAVPDILGTALKLVRDLWETGTRNLLEGNPAAGLAGLAVTLLVVIQSSALVLLALRCARLAATRLPLAARNLFTGPESNANTNA